MTTHNERLSKKWLFILFFTFVLSIIIYESVRFQSTTSNIFFSKLASDTSVAGIALALVSGSAIGIVSLMRSGHTPNFSYTERSWRLVEQLANAGSWQDLSKTLFSYISHFMPIEMGVLSVYNPALSRYMQVAEWRPSLQAMEGAAPTIPNQICLECIMNQSDALRAVTPCDHAHPAGITVGQPRIHSYCFPLVMGRRPVAKLHLYLYGPKTPTQVQLKQLNSLAPEMALAIQEVAISVHLVDDVITPEKTEKLLDDERHKIARDLHDSLGQDLAYLRLKLDQLANTSSPENLAMLQNDLVRMLGVANEAYNKVREEIVFIEPVRSVDLNRSVKDMLVNVGERSGFKTSFNTNHAAHLFPPDVQHQEICIVREALNNIEKHAQANHVSINMEWREKDLMVKISDNGRGFQMAAPAGNHHYGLSIMRERAESIQGRVMLTSSQGVGTEVTLAMPLSQALSMNTIQVNSIIK